MKKKLYHYLHNSKKINIILVSTGILFLTVLPFQNCSKTHFTNENLQQSSQNKKDVLTQEMKTRTLDITLESQENNTLKSALKVILVIDNSKTMTHSQNNLQRNIQRLLSGLEKKDAEVIVLSTDSYAKNSRFIPTSPTDQIANITYDKGFQRTVDQKVVYKFNKTDSNSDFQNQLLQVSTEVKKLGTSGNSNEGPLLSFIYYLKFSNYLKNGDTPLIYFITDENDKISFPADSSQKFFEKYYSNSEPYIYTNNQISCTKCFEFSKTDQNFSEDGSFLSNSLSTFNFANLTECLNFEKIYESSGSMIISKCQLKTFSVGQFLSTTDSSCEDYYKANPSQNKNDIKCDTVSSTGNNLSTRKKYLLLNFDPQLSSTTSVFSFDQSEKISLRIADHQYIQSFKKELDTRFNGRYIIGASVHIANQNCKLSTGQSLDKTFILLQKFFPKNQMIVDSICDSTKFLNSLDTISSEFNKIIKTTGYFIDADLKTEEIEEINLIYTDGKILKLNFSDFEIKNNFFSIKNSAIEFKDVAKAELRLRQKK